MAAQCNYHPAAVGDWFCAASKTHAFFIAGESVHRARSRSHGTKAAGMPFVLCTAADAPPLEACLAPKLAAHLQ